MSKARFPLRAALAGIAAFVALPAPAMAAEELNALIWCDHADADPLKPFEDAHDVRANTNEYEGTAVGLGALGQSQPGDRHFEAIHTSGHSPGGIALWEAATGVLISGDIVYDGPRIEGTTGEEALQYIASMKRLLDLPARVVHGGNFPSYSGERHQEIITAWLTEKGA